MTRNTAAGASTVATVLVTHNGGRHLVEQLRSIKRQTRVPDAVVWVDDRSSDDSVATVRQEFQRTPAIDLIEIPAPAFAPDLYTRIAANFQAGISAAAGRFDYIALCDQDDIWESNRIERQLARLAATGASMSTADGSIIHSDGTPVGESLRDRFPLLCEWSTADPAARLRSVLRQPMATGAASMITRELASAALPIPPRWLHDRWLSLVAAARGELDVDPQLLISYRIYCDQAVGLTGKTGLGGWSRFVETARRPLINVRKLWDLSVRLRRVGHPALRPKLKPAAIMRTYLAPVPRGR